jgi:2-dehydropantoate 2-reductase
MKICVVGAGAIGGLMGARLALSGEEVTLVARGPHLAAIQAHGLRLILEDGAQEHLVRQVRAAGQIADAGPHDVVILALKAHQIENVAAQLPALFHPETLVVTVQNGIPWWYFQKHGGEHDGRRLESLDPHGVIEANVAAGRIIGSIAYPAAQVSEPGVIRHVEGNRFPVGELDGSRSERVKTLSETLTRAGFKSPVLTDIRSQIWLKALGNLSFNPISALTRATLAEIARFPETRELAATMMREAQQIAQTLGITFRVSIEQRIAGAEGVGEHKTSMLQDLETGRPLELEALVGVILELGRLTATPTPSIDAVYACVKLLANTSGSSASGRATRGQA